MKVVVLGTGFAGSSFIETFNRNIKKDAKKGVELIAVNSKNYLLFSPLLYEVATGRVYEYHVSIPVCCTVEDEGYKFVEAEIKEIVPDRREVITSKGVLHYDRLIIALGSESNDFGIDGVKEHAIPLKTLKDGKRARDRVLESYKEAISRINEGCDIGSLMTFVIIGGGATGVELSASLLEFIDDLNRNHGRRGLKPKVVLVELQNRLMKNLGEDFSERLSTILKKKGVELSLDKKVVKVTENGVTFSDGSYIPSNNVFWTAGIKANSIVSSFRKKSIDGMGERLVVDGFLKIPAFENIYVVGDSALLGSNLNETFVPQTAAAAVQEGKYLGTLLAHELNGRPSNSEFTYRDHGTFLSAGRFSGICKFSNGLMLTGFSAWFIWRFIHLLRISTLKNRFEILSDWTFSWFHNGVFIESE